MDRNVFSDVIGERFFSQDLKRSKTHFVSPIKLQNSPKTRCPQTGVLKCENHVIHDVKNVQKKHQNMVLLA